MEVTKQANDFRTKYQKVAKAVLELQKDWFEMTKSALAMQEDDFDSLPVETQIICRKSFLKSPFNFGLGRMIQTAVLSGGLEGLVIPEEGMRKTHETEAQIKMKAEAEERKKANEAQKKAKADAKVEKEAKPKSKAEPKAKKPSGKEALEAALKTKKGGK